MSPGPTQGRERLGFRLELAAELSVVRLGVERVLDFLRLQGLDSEELSACELALVEACNNAIEHARPDAKMMPVGLEVVCDAQGVEFRVEDHTGGFEWPERPHLPPDESEHGRGLYLIDSLTQSVEYLRGRAGNVLVMRLDRKDKGAGKVPESVAERALRVRLEESEGIIRDMADELSSCYESLSAIFRYSGEQGESVGIQEFTERLLGDLLQVTGNAWYLVRLREPQSAMLVTEACSNAELDFPALPMPGPDESAVWLEVQAALQHRDRWFEQGVELKEGDPLLRFGAGGFGLVHPLYLGDELVGTLAIGGCEGERRFTAARTSVVQTFGDFLAIQVVNNRFQEARLRNLLVAQELDIAKKIQRSLLPTSLPQWPGFLLLGNCESASEVGGDFYDVIPLSEFSFLVVVSDAMGKGLPAAMFAMILRSLVRALQDYGPRPGFLLHRANDLLYDELSRVEMFITAQVAYVDRRASRVILANAGHCPLLHCPGPGRRVEARSPEGMPLGVMQEAEFLEETLELESGGRVLVYTDGVTETVAPGGEFFGQARLAAWLEEQTTAEADADAMRCRLVDRLAEHQGSPVLVDDQTFVILGR